MASLKEILSRRRDSLESVLFKRTANERKITLSRLKVESVLEARQAVGIDEPDKLLLVLAELLLRQVPDEGLSRAEALEVLLLSGGEAGQLAVDISEMAGMRFPLDREDDPTPFGSPAKPDGRSRRSPS